MATIARNATLRIADLKQRLTRCTAYTLDNQFQGAGVAPEHAWAAWERNPRAKLTGPSESGTYTITVHSNHWYELREAPASPLEEIYRAAARQAVGTAASLAPLAADSGSEGEAESVAVLLLDEDRGYAEQAQWLRGGGRAGGMLNGTPLPPVPGARQPLTLDEARNCLLSRRATLGDNPYNRGGTQATADYVAMLDRAARQGASAAEVVAAERNTRWVRYHAAERMTGLRELSGVTPPAVVLRNDGSADVYGNVTIIDQAHQEGS